MTPGAYMNNTQTQIAGTAFDGASGVAKVEVALSSDSAGGNGTWYNGTSFTVNLSSNTCGRARVSWSNLGRWRDLVGVEPSGVERKETITRSCCG